MSEFFLNTNNGISVLVRNANKEFSNEEKKYLLENAQTISQFRGNILSISISIESWLERSIEYLIFDVQDESSVRFNKFVLGSGYLSFYQKYQIFRNLCKDRNGEKSTFDKILLKNIGQCIGLRNVLAHGQLVYDKIGDNFYISWFKKGKPQEILIDGEYIKIISTQFYECINSLNELHKDDKLTTKKNKVKK